MNKFVKAAAVAAVLWANAAVAGEISNLTTASIRGIFPSTPLGQSFTAIDPDLLSIGFGYFLLSPSNPVSPITINLFAGAGTDGTIIATRSFTLANENAFFDTDFTGTSLIVGDVYTAALSANNARLGVFFNSNQFAGGRIFSPLSLNNANADLSFRVIGTNNSPPIAAVPEPAMWAMMMIGFGLVDGAMRSRRLVPGLR